MENFFAKGFQFEKYINGRLLEISNEGERRALKEVIKETLVPFYNHAEDAYIELEKRFIHTEKLHKEKYEIITGVHHRNKIDITEEALVPMCYEDLNETIIDVYDMKTCLQRGESYTAMKVFVQLDYAGLRRLEKERRSFKATLFTQDAEYVAEVQLKKNKSYLKQVSDLYKIFESNGLEWNTVCAPYLQKYYDVQIFKTDYGFDKEVIRISIDFQEYKDNIIYDLVPVWNVRFLEERTGAYPDLALDQIHYEHCINMRRFVSGRDYLVVSDNKKIWNTFRQNGELHIITNEDKPTVWKILELGYDSLEKSYDMPIFRNLDNNINKRCIHTIAEVKRYIVELGYDTRLKLLEVKQIDSWKETFNTYSVDDFIDDEIRVSRSRPHLCFKFQPKNDSDYLNQDIMSYLVSKIQWQLPEFKCVGVLE